MQWCREGNITVLSKHIEYMRSLVQDKEGHVIKICSRVPGTLEHDGKEQYPSLLLGLKCLQKLSDLYLPDSILDNTEDLVVS